MSYTINIIGRLESTTGIGHVTTSFANVLQKIKPTNILTTRTNHLHANDLNTGNCKITALEHAKISPQSICIYTDVLSNGPHDTNAQKTNPESLNFAYTMFDSTRIPREWIDILHKHFDAAIVPSEHLIPIYERSGFSKPIFCLPLILNLDSLLQEPVNQQKIL